MRNSVTPLSRADYKRKVVDKLIAAQDMETYWTEIQLTKDGGIDVVTCYLRYAFTGPRVLEVNRWWHSQQHGYWKNIRAAIRTAKSHGRPFHVVNHNK